VTRPDRSRRELGLLVRWIRARLLVIRRTPRAAFFTIVFPLVLLALLNATSGSSKVSVPGGKVAYAQYFAPSIGIYALAVSCYTVPIFGLASARELGILKRVRGTPLSPWIYLAAWLLSVVVMGVAGAALMVVVSVPAFGVHIYPSLLPAAVVTAFLGAACLAAIGLAVSTVVRRADTAPAISNLTLFPLLFLSGVFFPLEGAPGWLVTLAHVFPLSHIVEAFTACFSPYTSGSGFAPRDLAEIALWGAGGLFVAVRRFRWEAGPQEPGTRHRLRLPRLGSAAQRG
jgi:ABC-2 type transport system permease protein